jgi:hypothetical protein
MFFKAPVVFQVANPNGRQGAISFVTFSFRSSVRTAHNILSLM